MALSLTQKQTLQTKLSPQQIQIIRLLEIPGVELQRRINEELQENPALDEGKDPEALRAEAEQKRSENYDGEEYEGEEYDGEEYSEDGNDDTVSREDLEEALYPSEIVVDGSQYDKDDDYANPLDNPDFNYDAYVSDDETPEYKTRLTSNAAVQDTMDSSVAGSPSLVEHLKSQVYLTHMTKPERHIAKFVVGNIDEDGYLRRTAEELEDDLAFRESLIVPHEQMVSIIEQIKQFDPPGVGAYDLKECLLLQLAQREPSPTTQKAITVLTEQFEAFSRRHFDKIRNKCNLTEEEMHDVISEIEHLNPTPGAAWAGSTYATHGATIIPDFIVENRDGELVMQLLDSEIPDLHVSTDYQQMMRDYAERRRQLTESEKEAVQFVKAKIDSAKWFIDAIKQRNETLTRTMMAIIEAQRDFFYEGDDAALKPMILQDIADKTGYDVSTISRVSNSKYVQTEFGIYPLRHFFSEGMQNVEGDEISTREIKQALREIIDHEDKAHPLNDDELVQAMKDAGYTIARRTISKYRQQMGKTIARLRKQM